MHSAAIHAAHLELIDAVGDHRSMEDVSSHHGGTSGAGHGCGTRGRDTSGRIAPTAAGVKPSVRGKLLAADRINGSRCI